MDIIYTFETGDKTIIGTGEEFIQAKLNFEKRQGRLKAGLYGRIISGIYNTIRDATPKEIEIYYILSMRRRLNFHPASLLGKYHLVQ